MPNKIDQNKLMIEIQAPKFDVYEFLTQYLNEQERTVKVVRRWFDLDDSQWWYKIQESEVLTVENAFSVLTEVS